MASYCTSKNKKVTVTLTKNGNTIKITSNNPPLEISCKNNTPLPDCERVRVTWGYVEELNGSIQPVKFAVVNLRSPVEAIEIRFDGKQIWIKSRGSAQSECKPSYWDIIQAAPGNWVFKEAYISSIQSLNTPNPSSNKNTGVIIRDARGLIIFDDDNIDCNWDVQCDDDCPEGTYKCPSPFYPGYCCLDCASTSASIRAITNDLRSKNG
jgi:hypothetical protein